MVPAICYVASVVESTDCGPRLHVVSVRDTVVGDLPTRRIVQLPTSDTTLSPRGGICRKGAREIKRTAEVFTRFSG